MTDNFAERLDAILSDNDDTPERKAEIMAEAAALVRQVDTAE